MKKIYLSAFCVMTLAGFTKDILCALPIEKLVEQQRVFDADLKNPVKNKDKIEKFIAEVNASYTAQATRLQQQYQAALAQFASSNKKEAESKEQQSKQSSHIVTTVLERQTTEEEQRTQLVQKLEKRLSEVERSIGTADPRNLSAILIEIENSAKGNRDLLGNMKKMEIMSQISDLRGQINKILIQEEERITAAMPPPEPEDLSSEQIATMFTQRLDAIEELIKMGQLNDAASELGTIQTYLYESQEELDPNTYASLEGRIAVFRRRTLHVDDDATRRNHAQPTHPQEPHRADA